MWRGSHASTSYRRWCAAGHQRAGGAGVRQERGAGGGRGPHPVGDRTQVPAARQRDGCGQAGVGAVLGGGQSSGATKKVARGGAGRLRWCVPVPSPTPMLCMPCCCCTTAAAAAALVDVLTKYEHTPVVVAGVLRYTIQQWDDGRLVGGGGGARGGRVGGGGTGSGGARVWDMAQPPRPLVLEAPPHTPASTMA